MAARKLLDAIVPYDKAGESRQKYVRLDLNENRFPPAPGIVRALRRLAAGALAMYPESEPLRLELANAHGLEKESVLLSAGGDQAIRWVFEALVDPGATVAWAEPTFSMYPLVARLRQATVLGIPFDEDFRFPLAGILGALKRRLGLLVLVSPNNPTGTMIADGELRQILTRSGRTPVLLDEAYGFFSGRDHAAWIKEFPNLVILNSFSKSFALAGLRLGYLLGAGGLVREIEKVAPPFPLSAAAIQAGLAALADVDHARQQALRLQRQKSSLLQALEKLGVTCRDTEANFILARFADAGAVWEKLRQRGVLVKRLAHEPQLADRLRITVGTRDDHRRLLAALAEILPPQALLLDMDGVLVDSRQSCDEAILRTVRHFCGRRPRRRRLRDLRMAAGYNNDWRAAAALIRENGCRVSFARVQARFQEIYLGGAGRSGDGLRCREKWLAMPALLAGLRRRFRLGIVTGRPRAEALWTLERSGCAG
ncbi:MAG: histidinol-phosphate transaminase, partial [Candidatus Aminicenantes bacterium]|nr:histidinol-phosphate transaminase [Candidatus Aminicenantes bacterium]